MRTSVSLSQEQLRKLALFCRREKISRAEAVRRAVDRFLQSSSVPDLRSFLARPELAGIFRDRSPGCAANGVGETGADSIINASAI